MEEQLSNPDRIERYGPKVIKYHMIPQDPINVYMGFLEGSHIVLEGACKGFNQLVKAVEDSDTFDMTPVLDQSHEFTCACCRPGAADSEEEEADVKAETNPAKFEHIICMIVQGDAWQTPRSEVFTLLLQPTDQTGTTFERVGCLNLPYDESWVSQAEYDADAVNKIFDDISWDRRILKLV